ncbi:M28 family peptidase [Sphingomonas panacisoli]|uniref:M28 family peptidase n=1 Tax=Sphingomonas panacisoli TaxID=1813879 RepID=A0A5B8LJ44_9SPHN|nr:M28 family peptidase [Sphingomonas panacisoli]QDZ07140.1 M28 family peptidase [Sphingomonas panacisoli]
MRRIATIAAIALTLVPLTPATSRDRDAPVISAASVRTELELLAGPALRGRGSATPDEAIAAGYVAALFRDAGLRTAPGMDSYLQTAPIVRRTVAADPTLTIGGTAIPGVTVLRSGGGQISGTAAILRDPAGAIPQADVVVYTGPADQFTRVYRAVRGKAKLLLTTETQEDRDYRKQTGVRPRLRVALKGVDSRPDVTVAALSADALGRVRDGDAVMLDIPVVTTDGVTTNAIGYLPGTDPKAGVILVSAHLDHLGVRNGKVMPGANDDASGTVAVIELARAFAAMGPSKRGVLFVAYGSEELGGLGSTWFGLHPPIPLERIVANIELEMIGQQDAKLPKGSLMMTGAERSDLFAMLRANGALVAPDPYPEEHYFERSDNYSLALKGIVAHTLSGWVGPTYHQPTDTVDSLDLDYMTAAINSLVRPIRMLADAGYTPRWKSGGRPQ